MGETRPYRDLLLERLANPEVAQHYLNDALDESLDAFLKAVETVAQARRVSNVRTESDVLDGSLDPVFYERGDSSVVRLSSLLNAAGLKLSIALQVSPQEAQLSRIRT